MAGTFSLSVPTIHPPDQLPSQHNPDTTAPNITTPQPQCEGGGLPMKLALAPLFALGHRASYNLRASDEHTHLHIRAYTLFLFVPS